MRLRTLAPTVSATVIAGALTLGFAPVASASTTGSLPSLAISKSATATEAKAVDALWLKTIAAGDLFEIASGRQASAKATVAGTKGLGLMLIKDHSAHLLKVRALAKARGVALPTEVAPADQAKIDALADQTGLQFDRNWLRTQAAAHRTTYILTGKARLVSRDPQVLDLERKTLPVVKLHQIEALATWVVIAPPAVVPAS